MPLLSWPQVAPIALETSENILMCAPTGAGKTNVAMLAILHTLSLYRDAATGAIDADKFKIIYVAPMKVCSLGQRATESLAQAHPCYCTELPAYFGAGSPA